MENMENTEENLDSREGSNSVSTPQELSSRKNIITVPSSALKIEAGEYYVIHRRKVYKLKKLADGRLQHKTYGMTWFVEVV
jgi:hypothetical protein